MTDLYTLKLYAWIYSLPESVFYTCALVE